MKHQKNGLQRGGSDNLDGPSGSVSLERGVEKMLLGGPGQGPPGEVQMDHPYEAREMYCGKGGPPKGHAKETPYEAIKHASKNSKLGAPMIQNLLLQAIERGDPNRGGRVTGKGLPEAFRSRGVSKKLLLGTWPGSPQGGPNGPLPS